MKGFQREPSSYSAAPPADSCVKDSDMPAGKIESRTDKREEYKGNDDLTEENRNAQEVTNEYNCSHGSLPPASVAPVAQSTCFDGTATTSSTATGENSDKGKRPIEEAANAKPYPCRFCNQTFYKSQALGGHMNRHRQEIKGEKLNEARKLISEKGNPFQNQCPNNCSPSQGPQQFTRSQVPQQFTRSQVLQQFTGTSTHGSWQPPPPLQSQFTGIPALGLHNQTPSQLWCHRRHQRSNSTGSIGDMIASGCTIQYVSQVSNTVPIRQLQPQPHNQADERNQEPQPRNQPQHLHSDANTGDVASASFGASMRRNYQNYQPALRQDLSSSSSSPMSVPERFLQHRNRSRSEDSKQRNAQINHLPNS